jgi:DNA-directed RNA polymerase subunit RPC12/RpoP
MPEDTVHYQCTACAAEFWTRDDLEGEPEACPFCGSDELTTD